MEGSSRFERLFALIEKDGGSRVTRLAAVGQVVEIFKLQRSCLGALLAKTVPLLASVSGEARFAAAELVRQVAAESLAECRQQLPEGPVLDVSVARVLRDSALLDSGREMKEPDTKKAKVSGGERFDMRDAAKSQERLALVAVVAGEEEAPFSSLAAYALASATSPKWEARHGALLTLKALLEAVGPTLTSFLGLVVTQAFRVLCLDRFNDFSGSRVSSSVREVAAQIVGIALEYASEAAFNSIVSSLLELVDRGEWQLRHGGFLGLRYAANRRSSLMRSFAPRLVAPTIEALRVKDDEEVDEDEDVIAVAAEAILPFATDLAIGDAVAAGKLVELIWDRIGSESLDDLTACMGCLLRLLSAFYAIPAVAQARPLSGEKRVNLLLPLFEHKYATSMRLALAETLTDLVAVRQPEQWAVMNVDSSNVSFLTRLFSACFRLFGTENDEGMTAAAHRLWSALLTHSTPGQVYKAAFPFKDKWLKELQVESANVSRMRVNGTAAIAKLQQLLPPQHLAPEVAASVVRLCSASAGERVVGALCLVNLFSATSVTVLDAALVAALRQKLEQALAAISNATIFLEDKVPGISLLQIAARRCLVAGATSVALIALAHEVVIEAAMARTVFGNVLALCKTEPSANYRTIWAEHGFVPLVRLYSGSANGVQLLRAVAGMLVQDRLVTPLAGTKAAEEAADAKDAKKADDDDFVAPDTVAHLGALSCFKALGSSAGSVVLHKEGLLSVLWSDVAVSFGESGSLQGKIDALRLVQTLVSSIPPAKADEASCRQVLLLLCDSMNATENCWEAQSVLAEGISAVAQLFPVATLRHICLHVLNGREQLSETGQIALIASIQQVLQVLQVQACPFLAFMVVPVLGSMSSRDEAARRVAASAFAQIVSLMPLETGAPDPPGFGAELSERRAKERVFIKQLLGGEPPTLNEFDLRLVPTLQLRPYQLAGIAWLAFLARYKLHGILADDMGLGKTVQALCAVSVAVSQDMAQRPSLIVCPSSVVYHWMAEAESLFARGVFKAVAYEGTPQQRKKLGKELSRYNLVVTSYEVLRSDCDRLAKHSFLYCVLDEGHIIRNSKTKTTLAAKAINAAHRLVLSGTPLQNDVVELWSLFDFLSPGYLGSQSEFRSKYGRHIAAAKDAQAKRAARESGTLALEALHRQILPFIMRRTKESVLDDLPDKIIQDYLCNMSPLQSLLYDEFSGKESEPTGDAFSHKLRMLCSHPRSAVEKMSDAVGRKVMDWLKAENSTMDDAEHSGKLLALETLLRECGIGEVGGEHDAEAAPHRVLLFCQFESSLDLVQSLLLNKRMPTVTFLRFDGKTPQNKRMDIVKRFNTDPTIDVLLLTVKAGGLGLTLTGADTVIFFEHDWNPQVDLQAMDRAHRLGQKRVVNVYRLITRNTMEERMMSLQQFKLRMTQAVVNEENASMATMDTGALLDLANANAPTPMQTGEEEDEDLDLEEASKYAK